MIAVGRTTRSTLRAGAAVGALTLAGCASPAPDSSTAPGTTARPVSALEAALAADNGLELRRLLVRDESDDIVATLGRFGRDAIDDDYLRSRLERNGLRLRLMSEQQTEDAVTALGRPLRDARVWYGQATQWRELSRRNVGPGLTTIVDGRARAFSSGALRLLSRAWTLPMEDGLRLTIELVPHFDPVGSGGYRAMLGRDTMRGERFDALQVELHLRPGEVLLLTADAPGRAWQVPPDERVDRSDGTADDRPTRQTAARSATDDSDEPGRAGVDVGPGARSDVGPPSAAPLTLGELLLCGERPPVRNVLIFLPRLPGDARVTTSGADVDAPPDGGYGQ